MVRAQVGECDMSVGQRIKIIVPIPMDAAGVANRASQLPPEAIAPGFQPEFAAVNWGAALGDSYHDMLLMDWTVFQASMQRKRAILRLWSIRSAIPACAR
jgi:allantoin racemase